MEARIFVRWFTERIKESRNELRESREEYRAAHKLILQQLQSLSTKGSGSIGESSEDTHSDPILQEMMNTNLGPNFFFAPI